MADDITARILLSVEYADAVKKCKDVEVGLEDITKARQSDLNTVKAATNAANANAQAMEREAAAAEKVAKATKKKQESSDKVVKGWEVLGITQEEYERRAKAAADASAKATAEYNKRWDKRLSADAAPKKTIERDKYFSDFKKSLNDTFSKNTIKATSNLTKLNKTVAQSENAFLRATRGVGRSLGHIARVSGRSLGMEVTTEGMTGAGGAFMAGSLAIGGIAMLGKGIMDLYRERRTNRIEDAERNLTEMRSTTDRMQEEAEARQKSIDVLKDLNNSENLTAAQRVTQGRIVATLNKRLKGMSVEIDSASGRIKNLGAVEENILRSDNQAQIERMQQELRFAMAERARHEKFLSEAGALTEVFDKAGIREASAAEQKLTERILELQKSIGNLNKTLTAESAAERSSMRNAQLSDAIAKEGAILKSFRFAATERAYEMKWAGNDAGRERYEARRDAALIKNLREQRVKEQSELDKIRGEYRRYSEDTPERTRGLERYYTQQKKLIKTNREIDMVEQRIHARRMRSIQESKKEQTPFTGWQSIAGFMQRESFKYRDTTTAAVMANSLEGVRLQNRQLVANTPEKALLNVNQKQYSMLEKIRSGIDRMAARSSGTTLQTRTV